MVRIDVYSDGSAQTKDKPGGWASVILIDGIFYKEISGHLEFATNNDAELEAAIKGLECAQSYLKSLENPYVYDQVEVTLISDSEIVLSWANGSYKFKQIDKLQQYEKLIDLVKSMKVQTKWVKGHSGDQWNSRCDKLANMARKGITEKVDKSIQNNNTRIGTKKNGVVCLWFANVLKVVDFEHGIIEDFDRELHGKRGSVIEIREDKNR